MYETQWKTVTIDVEQYAGKAIKLEFNVNNVGDNTYNSAVLIDNVLAHTRYNLIGSLLFFDRSDHTG